ncbi:endonuclease G, mitochondrial [Drosophila bipectinata]|uniref:endonuclease G, mitochondrial n=1 Tax=Drosophila bipectinata TaxID=42026 RepID=UPI001C88E711|nr:endonuclease G, mitochondrial [Drosophila bipectinata]
MEPKWQFLAFGVVLTVSTVSLSFVAGMYFQQQDAKKRLNKIIEKDPYAYYVSPKFDEVFGLFEDQEHHTHRMAKIMKYGFPGLDDLRLYSDFVLSYDRRNRVAHWVCEHLEIDQLRTDRISRRNRTYQPDMRVPSNFRSELTDYRRSGFDRGHLAAAGNHHLELEHCQDTFFLTNVAPQIGEGFNRGAWRNLETYVRNLVHRFGSVYVCTGPLYKPHQKDGGKFGVEYEMIGLNMVAVPTHFFKVIMVESILPMGKPYMEGYVLPNAEIPKDLTLRSFLCDIREIEHYAGLKFFDGIRRSAIFGSNYSSESQVFRDFR